MRMIARVHGSCDSGFEELAYCFEIMAQSVTFLATGAQASLSFTPSRCLSCGVFLADQSNGYKAISLWFGISFLNG